MSCLYFHISYFQSYLHNSYECLSKGFARKGHCRQTRGEKLMYNGLNSTTSYHRWIDRKKWYPAAIPLSKRSYIFGITIYCFIYYLLCTIQSFFSVYYLLFTIEYLLFPFEYLLLLLAINFWIFTFYYLLFTFYPVLFTIKYLLFVLCFLKYLLLNTNYWIFAIFTF